jgi:hypothetical protein
MGKVFGIGVQIPHKVLWISSLHLNFRSYLKMPHVTYLSET